MNSKDSIVNKFKNEVFKTKRLILVPLSLKYKKFLFENSKSSDITKYTTIIGAIKRPSLEDVTKYIKGLKKSSNLLVFVILLKESDMPIGVVGLNQIDLTHKSCTTFSWLSKKYWGYGYLFEAKKKLFKFIFNKLKLHRIESRCDFKNKKIIKHLKSLGFIKEGQLRDYIFYKGKYRTELIFGLLKDEFKDYF